MKVIPRFILSASIYLQVLALVSGVLQAQPTNVALNQPTGVSSIFGSAYPGENAVDGNSSSDTSRWLSAGGGSLPQWIEIDLGNTYNLSQFKFWTGKNGVGTFPLYDFALQQWNGAAWVDIHSVTASTNTGAVDESFAATVASNRVRLNVTAAQDNIVRLFELEIYGEAHGLGYSTLSPANGSTSYTPAVDLVITFDAAIVADTLSGVRIEDVAAATDVTGVSASVSGNQLTISHGGLTDNKDYAVHVPADAVELSSDSNIKNGSIYWSFSTAAAAPQLVTYTKEIPVVTDAVTLDFDRDISIANAAGISLRRALDNSAVTGVSASVTGGNVLSIGHDTLNTEEGYIVQLDAGAIQGVSNAVGNAELRRAVYTGVITLFSGTFEDGTDGFQFAKNLISGATGIIQYHRETDTIGPNQDTFYIYGQSNWEDDYALSPLVALDAGEVYTLEMKIQVERGLKVGLVTTTTPDLTADVEALASYSSNGSKNLAFSPSVSGSYYVVFYHGVTNPWQDMRLDSITLTRAIDPVVRIFTPTDASTHLESDDIPVTVEAYSIAGDLDTLELFDDSLPEGEILGTLSASGEMYSYTWDHHVPGARTLTATATDSFGNQASDSIPVTITFDDGSLPAHIGYDFDYGWNGWTRYAATGDASSGIQITGVGVEGGQAMLVTKPGSESIAVSSPQVNLFHGETYTLSFRAKSDDETNTYGWAWLVDEAAGYPTDLSEKTDFTVTPNWDGYQYTFTVPYDGVYYLTLFDPTISGYERVYFDDIRIIGTTNATPVVTLDYPDSKITTIQGIDLEFRATASDSDGTITKVEFYRDAFKLGEVTSSPYNFVWENVPFGLHNVYARAHDANGATTDTESVVVDALENGWSIATLLGKSTDTSEMFTGAGYLSDGTLVVGGILDPTLLPGVTPIYLNGTSTGDKGFVALLSEDGTSVQKVVVVGDRVLDLDIGGGDRIYVAASGSGVVVLNSAADTILWSQDYADFTHRIDAAGDGTFAVLNSPTYDHMDERILGSTNYVYDANYTQLGSMGGAAHFTNDVAIDTGSQTVCFLGWKNITQMEGPHGDTTINPVDIPVYKGYAYDGTLKFRGYDWEQISAGDRFLNLITNNMADTRGSRIHAGDDGYFYMGIEFDGGNTPLRYDPFDVTLSVQNKIIGGAASGNHGMANTSTVPKVFVGRYTTDTGDFVLGQWITNRIANGNDNTIRIRNGNITTDAAGRIHVVGASSAGLPITMDHIPDGFYQGGNFHLVYSPDFATDEFLVRYSYGGGASGLPGSLYSNNFAVAVSQGGKVFSGGFASRKNFTYNAFQAELSGGDKSPDAYYSVADLSTYYNFQTGAHPRLFFDEGEIAVLREKVTKEPYLSMKNRLISMLDLDDTFRPYDPNDIREVAVRAQQEAFLYILTGDEAYAAAAKANIDAIIENSSIPWADPAVRGLDSYWFASKVAAAYDWCVNSVAWDEAFNYKVSRALKDIGIMIINNGGTEQSPSAASNWQGSRGASGVLALLASDHASNSALIDSGYDRVVAYLNGNLGTSSTTRGWNPEGQGYTYFPNGNYVGPFGIAMARHDPARDIRNHVGLRMAYWSIFAGATSAVDVYNFGGVKPDWSDDNAHIRGEGTYNQAFYYAYDSLKPGIMHMYDQLMGFGSDDVDDSAQKRWDSTRGGAIWGILYYPQDLESQDPSEIWDWHQAADDSGGMGMFTFRDAYAGDNDFLAQFKARLRDVDDFAHDAPDGLGFRIIGNANPWVVGGGRNRPGRNVQQASLYTSVPDPLNQPTTLLNNTGTLVGTPLVRPDGGGHVIASMATTNVGVSNHKRWFVANYDSAATGADATYVVGDTSDDGVYWQLPTFLLHTVSISGNTFTVTAADGSSMKGTVLHPTSGYTLSSGTMERGSGYAMTSGGSLATEDAPISDTRIEENNYIHLNHTGGDFLVVLTVQSSGDTHPTPVLNSGAVADANLDIGSLNLALQSNDVLYNGSAYSAPGVTVTFDAGSGGSITSGNAVQSLAYGAAATEPTLSVNSGNTFIRWDKAFDAVTQTMTVSAVYYDETGNTAPVVDAGSDFSVEVLDGYTLAATVTDDGLPNPRGFVSQNWTQVSGPGAATFNNDLVTAATVSFDLTGTYVLRLTATDGVSQSSDDVTVTVNPIAGPGYLRFVSNSYTVAEDGNTATVDVVRYNGGEGAISVDYATGDSSASAGSDYTTTSGTLSWAAGQSDVKQITVAINEDVDVEGDEVLIVSLSNPTGGASVGTISQTGITITDNDVNVAPSISFTDPTGSAVTVAVNTPLNLAVSVSDDGQPLPVALTWTKVSGPGGVLFGNMTAASTTATFDTIGNYVIKITAHDGAAGTSLTLGVTVNLDGTGGNNYLPVAVADAATLDEDTYALLDVLANDSDGDAGQILSISGFTQPSNGSVTQEGADLLYIPTLGFTGADSFTYTVTDGTDSDIGLVNLTVNDTAEDAYVDFNKTLIGDYEDADPPAGGSIETLASYPFSNIGATYAATRTPGTQATGITASDITLHGLAEEAKESRSGVLGFNSMASSYTDYVKYTLTGNDGATTIDLNGGVVSMDFKRWNGGSKSLKVTLIADGTSIDLTEVTVTTNGTLTYTSETIVGLPVSNIVEIRMYFKTTEGWSVASIDNLAITGAVNVASPSGDTFVEDAGATLRMNGNGWYDVSKSYTLTANTHLQFEFKADPQGEIQGIGVDDGASLTLFQLYGTQTLAGINTDFADYAGSDPNYKTYSIPVGAYRTGDITAIILANDDDAGSGANAWFKNVRLVEIELLTPAEQWRDTYFGQTANTGDAADNFDFDTDGLVNLLERAFKTLPNDSSSFALPSESIVTDTGFDYLAISYRRLTGGTGTIGVDYTADGITYTVEYDEDLVAPWSSGGVTAVGDPVGNGDGTETVTVRLDAPIGGATKYFIRVKVTSGE